MVCTLGPASERVEVLCRLIEAGMDVARFNLSHGSHRDHRVRLEALRAAEAETGKPVAVLFDGKGPEVRLGEFRDGGAALEEGARFILTVADVVGDSRRAPVTHKGLTRDVRPGDVVLLDDGNASLVVERVSGEDVQCSVTSGGFIKSYKKVTVPGRTLSLPSFTEEDLEDVKFAVSEGADYFAVSFVRFASDMLAVRKVVEELGADLHLIAKIETREGVENVDEILKVSDGLMVARGDLGVEMPPEDVPVIQKTLIARCNAEGKPVITATQMLESMITKPRPTRAEASDVANAIFDGTDAVMLSGETAVGEHPVEAVSIMDKIARRTEEVLPYEEFVSRRVGARAPTITEAVSHATCSIASSLNAAAIITATESGFTARMVAKYRPRAPVVAATPDPRVMRKLLLVWSVRPVLVPPTRNTDALMDSAVSSALRAGAIQEGDVVVLTAGTPVGVPGSTNILRVETVGDVVVRGVGIGKSPATGKVTVVKDLEEAREAFTPGDIVVTVCTDKEFMDLIKQASGLITEEGGLTSHGAIAGLSLGIPVIVGAEKATEILKNGMVVTIDPVRGLVYKGKARVL